METTTETSTTRRIDEVIESLSVAREYIGIAYRAARSEGDVIAMAALREADSAIIHIKSTL